MPKPIPARNLSNADRKAILELWQKSGQSLSAWRQENDTVKLRDDVIQLPHLSTLYDWASRLGFSTQPTEPEAQDDTNRTPSEPIPEELPDEPDEPDEADGPDESPAIHDDKEGEEDLLAKERIDQLEPSTAPDPQPNAPDAPDASGGKKGNIAKVVVLVGGVALAGVTVFLLIKWAKGRRNKKQEPQQTERVVNPFGTDLQTLP